MRRLRLVHGVLLVPGAGLLAASGGCNTQPIDQSLRALEESGRISFVCLGDPEQGSPVLPLAKCRNARAANACDFGSADDGGGGAGGGDTGATGTPHLYGLVTQTFRGEVAVLDFTTQANDRIVDQDPGVPGPSFLPVGGQPVGIVSTPGSTATFVTVAEVGREGIFAIPSTRLLRERKDPDNSNTCTGVWEDMPPAAEVSSWPACSLPAAPGEPILVNDPADDEGRERVSCDDVHETPATGAPNGDLTTEGEGRQKLVVPLPALGGVAVIDAQRLLDLPDGSFGPCPIDRWLLLDREVPPVDPPQPPSGPGCASLPEPDPTAVAGAPLPAGMAYAEGDLFVSDLNLPLIHRFDMASPCEPVLLPPLLPRAIEEPSRVVTTSRLAVTPRPTAGLKRYLYANDVDDRSVMAFDVSDGAATRTPLVRNHPEWTPISPRDRIRVVSVPRDIIVVSRDIPVEVPGTGVAPEGILCDPDPTITRCCDPKLASCCDKQNELECSASLTSCDPATLYRTSADFTSGAGPFKLRGTFAFVLLTSGQIQVIDVEDLDADCRGRTSPDPLFGCETIACVKDSDCPDDPFYQCTPGATEAVPGFCIRNVKSELKTTGEISCNVVTPNTLRSSVFVLDNSLVGANRPGLVTFPLLVDKTGALLEAEDPTVPVMRATLPPLAGQLAISINNQTEPVDPADGSPGNPTADHILLMNEETPQAQTIEQQWLVTFEGPLPGYGGTSAELRVKDASGALLAEPGIFDSNAIYCDTGVQSFEALREQLTPAGPPPTAEEQAAIDKQARLLADRIQIRSFLADKEDDYWADPTTACTFDACRATFGDGDAPLTGRDFMIREAYQDRLVLDPQSDAGASATLEVAKCCFPSLVSYAVRPANQWVVVAPSGNGFLHHVIPDPTTGVCRQSCDPDKARMNGRALRTPNSLRNTVVNDGAPTAFINQMFRFAIVDGTEPPQRDMTFSFSTSAGFSPLTVTLLSDTRDIAPVAITYVPPTGELAITDGALQGVITVSLASVSSARQFF
jgi:hypothetical protein